MNATLNMTVTEMQDALTADERYLYGAQLRQLIAAKGAVTEADHVALLTPVFVTRANMEAGKAKVAAKLKAKQAAKLALATGKAGR